MKLSKVLIFAGLSLLVTYGLVGCSTKEKTSVNEQNSAYSSPVPGNNTKTLENLQTAFNGETNANAKYLEFAKKADSEGFTKVASLFRAAARAEEIHAGNHAAVIKKLGGNPKSEVKLPEIKTTKENLEDSVKGETYERDTMYAEFLMEARNSGNKEAMKTFNFAKTAEGEHAKLYAEALANLESWKGGKTTFYVCPVCGFTTTNGNLEKCPVDFTAKEKFESIS
ncbi:MAG TPA: ferritin family protein [Pyrinomonadaceae bacterium]|nr:ferritin family protein [Pyrinomonadaceae bacterium]